MKDDYYFTVCCFSSATIRDAHGILRQLLSEIATSVGIDPASLSGELYSSVDEERTDQKLNTIAVNRSLHQRRCQIIDTLATLSDQIHLANAIGTTSINRTHVGRSGNRSYKIHFEYTPAHNSGRLIQDASIVISFPASMFTGYEPVHVSRICESLILILDSRVQDIICCFVDCCHRSSIPYCTGLFISKDGYCNLALEIDYLRWFRFVGAVPLRLRNVFWITHLTKAHVEVLGGFKSASEQIVSQIDPLGSRCRRMDMAVAETPSGGMCIRLFRIPCPWPSVEPAEFYGDMAVRLYSILRSAGFFAWR